MGTDTLVFVFDLLGATREKAGTPREPPCPTGRARPSPRWPRAARGPVVTIPATATPPASWSGRS